MTEPKLTKLELQIMEVLWAQGEASIRVIQETFPEKGRPAYTTIQTTIYRLEANGTPNRIRQTHAQRCKGSWKNPPKAGKKG